MKALNLFNVLLLALAGSFALTLGAVSIIYAVHLDAAPRMRSQWYVVLKVTLVFMVLTAASAATVWSQWRRLSWRWPAQSALLLTLAGSTAMLLQILG
ncbi:MAG TPA: hypothetical protein VIR56_02155 [Solimonas sp.]